MTRPGGLDEDLAASPDDLAAAQEFAGRSWCRKYPLAVEDLAASHPAPYYGQEDLDALRAFIVARYGEDPLGLGFLESVWEALTGWAKDEGAELLVDELTGSTTGSEP